MNWQTVLTKLAQNVDDVNDEALLSLVNQSERIFLAGAGRSGLALKSFAMRLTQLGKQAFVVGETTTPAITASDLLVIASSSGETTQLVQFAATASEVGATIWLWSTGTDSTIARQSQFVTLLAGKSKFADADTATKQPMGSLFEQSVWLFGDIFTMDYMQRYQITESFMKARHSNLE
ncbi:6-phospho-3-hexuloisomerase [Weissella cibaria]|uniref:SIS domain-containing protein n=1 Tax=Weissella cibaria TaxID=137591 RepID=A0A9Q8JII7_9LACO|nr:6-phospho-3-hexuloisomerase [Weissella cibaria]TVV27517.1 SIS domain-containing protein [Weissella cibaria]TVV40709.1 SIS domain-containing protein [Weissella cibaria]